jgi:hypothetical protein
MLSIYWGGIFFTKEDVVNSAFVGRVSAGQVLERRSKE